MNTPSHVYTTKNPKAYDEICMSIDVLMQAKNYRLKKSPTALRESRKHTLRALFLYQKTLFGDDLRRCSATIAHLKGEIAALPLTLLFEKSPRRK